LAKNWIYDSVTAIPNGGGDHSLMAADTDGDLGQELITGAYTIAAREPSSVLRLWGMAMPWISASLFPARVSPCFQFTRG